MQLSKDKDALIKRLEERDMEMQKMKDVFKQEKTKYHAQVKEAKKVIESLEADKGNLNTIACFVAVLLVSNKLLFF